jgi:hypothetical protein
MYSVGDFRHILKRTRSSVERLFEDVDTRAGKVTLVTVLGGAVFLAVFSFASFEFRVPTVSADDVTTSVRVLNTPPVWTVDAQEEYESSTTIPTNVGTSSQWIATGTDSNGEDYYLLICKTGSAPTPHSNAVPTCNGGISNTWATSAATPSGTQARASTTTLEAFPESNAWFAWICDGNGSLAQCNATSKQGTGSTASPFIVNHPPVFNSIANTGPVNPGAVITWTSNAIDTDTLTTNTTRLLVCKAADFSATTGACGVGGTWATSTLQASNPATSTTISIPYQDKTYNAFVYVVDAFGLGATSTRQGSNSTFAVNNIAPTLNAATISLVDPRTSGNLTLFNPAATSGPFYVQFQVNDDNSCQNSLSTNEIASSIANIYRSGVTQASCQLNTDYNSNSCYPAASVNSSITCTQDVASCSGPTDSTATWTCSFPLWYNADPTDASTPWTAQNWLASVRVTDDNGLTSTLTEGSTGNEVVSFLAFDVPQASVYFGALQPGDQTDPLATTTSMLAQGNIGLDQDIYGDTMCTTWTSPDSCDSNGISATNDITIANQKVATSSVAYASTAAFALTGSTSPTSFSINIPKTTATATPQQKDTYWGINIPGTLTVAGDYRGQDTITAKKSPIAFW